MRAVLDGADLSGADLAGADLTGASMKRAVLTGVNLDQARLDDVRPDRRAARAAADLSTSTTGRSTEVVAEHEAFCDTNGAQRRGA